MHSILPFPNLSSISGNLVTQASNQSKCGDDFIGHGHLDMKNFWRKELSGIGLTSTMSRIGVAVHVVSPKGFRTYRALKQVCLPLVGHSLAPEGGGFMCPHP